MLWARPPATAATTLPPATAASPTSRNKVVRGVKWVCSFWPSPPIEGRWRRRSSDVDTLATTALVSRLRRERERDSLLSLCVRLRARLWALDPPRRAWAGRLRRGERFGRRGKLCQTRAMQMICQSLRLLLLLQKWWQIGSGRRVSLGSLPSCMHQGCQLFARGSPVVHRVDKDCSLPSDSWAWNWVNILHPWIRVANALPEEARYYIKWTKTVAYSVTFVIEIEQINIRHASGLPALCQRKPSST